MSAFIFPFVVFVVLDKLGIVKYTCFVVFVFLVTLYAAKYIYFVVLGCIGYCQIFLLFCGLGWFVNCFWCCSVVLVALGIVKFSIIVHYYFCDLGSFLHCQLCVCVCVCVFWLHLNIIPHKKQIKTTHTILCLTSIAMTTPLIYIYNQRQILWHFTGIRQIPQLLKTILIYN